MVSKEDKEDDNKNHCDESKSCVADGKRLSPFPTRNSIEKKLKTDSSATTTANKGRVNKGLRHFSLMVCKKVEEKGTTTYNEVADELVKEFVAQREVEEDDESTVTENNKGKNKSGKKKARSYDEKNIRRRVYDALNVLMAMDILTKEKKEIRWNGLPSHTQNDSELLRQELIHRKKSLEQKRCQLQQTLNKFICYTNLSRRNQLNSAQTDDKIPLPFYVVNSNPDSSIRCEMSSGASSISLKSHSSFTLSENNDVLQNIGLNAIKMDELETILPTDIAKYCQRLQLLHSLPSLSPSPTSPIVTASRHSNMNHPK